MNSVQHVDVAVIGAGIVGTTIAEKLAQEGREVLLIDRQAPGEGCSKGNAGHFATDIVQPLANVDTLLSVPKMLLDPLGPLALRWSYLPRLLPWLMRFALSARPSAVRAHTDALRALNSRSISSYDRLLSRIKQTHRMIKRGAITVYDTQKGRHKHRSSVAVMREYGVNVEELDSEQIRELEPSLTGSLAGGLYFPDTAHTGDPFAVVQGVFEAFVQAGGRFARHDIKSVQPQHKSMILHTEYTPVFADQVIIAAGAWSKPLLAELGYRVPLETERGYHLMLPEAGVELSRPVSSFERSFVMTPMDAGLCLAGTVELAGLTAAPNWRRAEILFNHASRLLSDCRGQYAKRWMGFRPSLPDSLPVIGALPNHPQVYCAFGHQHLGLTQAAINAELVADQIAGRTPDIDLTPYRIDRF